jgi:hypothetical protein
MVMLAKLFAAVAGCACQLHEQHTVCHMLAEACVLCAMRQQQWSGFMSCGCPVQRQLGSLV